MLAGYWILIMELLSFSASQLLTLLKIAPIIIQFILLQKLNISRSFLSFNLIDFQNELNNFAT